MMWNNFHHLACCLVDMGTKMCHFGPLINQMACRGECGDKYVPLIVTTTKWHPKWRKWNPFGAILDPKSIFFNFLNKPKQIQTNTNE